MTGDQDPLLRGFMLHSTLAGLRPNSLRSRRNVLRLFLDSLEGRPLASAGRSDVEAFLSRPLSAAGRRSYRSHLRSLYAWALLEEYVTADPMLRIPSVKQPRALPRPMPPADLERALDAAAPRMRAWLLLMAGCGLRCLEVSAVVPSGLRPGPHGMELELPETKGGGTGVVPLHPAVVEALRALPVIDGRWWSVRPLGVSRQTNAYLRSLGITHTAHSLRHSAATAFYKASGHDLLLTARLLRHASVTSTQGYAQLDQERPAEVVSRLPLRLLPAG